LREENDDCVGLLKQKLAKQLKYLWEAVHFTEYFIILAFHFPPTFIKLTTHFQTERKLVFILHWRCRTSRCDAEDVFNRWPVSPRASASNM